MVTTARFKRTTQAARRALAIGCCLVSASLPAHAADPFTIDVVLPLTGAAAFLGTAEQQALQQAEKVLTGDNGIAGRSVHFAFHDDQSSPQVAVQLATEIAANKPPVVLGSAVVAMCNAMAPLMRRGPVLYCFSPGIYPAPGSFTFSSSNATRDLLTAQVRFFRSKGMTKLGIFTSTDASGQDAARNLKEILALPENKGVDVVAETTFNPSDVSAAAQIQRLKSAGPQAVICWSVGTAIGTVFKAIQDAGLNVPVATTDANMTYAAMQRYADILPAELYIPSPEWPRNPKQDAGSAVAKAKDQFFGAYAGTGMKPDAASSFAWDPAFIVVSELRKLGPGATSEQLRAAIAGLTGFVGINGDYDFVAHPQRGLDDSDVVITRWNKATGDWDVASAPRGVPF